MVTEDDQDVIEVEGQMTQQDYVRFVMWTGFRLPQQVWTGVFLFPMFLATALLSRAPSFLFALLLAVTMPVIVCFLLTRTYRAQAAKQYETYPFFRAPIRYRFSKGGMSYTSPVAQTSVAWAAYHRVEQTEHTFYLSLAAGAANIIPKRFFASEEQMERFRALLRANLPPEVCKV